MRKWFKEWVHFDSDQIWIGETGSWFFNFGVGIPYKYLWFLAGALTATGLIYVLFKPWSDCVLVWYFELFRGYLGWR